MYSVAPVTHHQSVYEYETFPALDKTLLGQPLALESATLMAEVAPLPRRIAPPRAATGELDFVEQELVMAKMSLSNVLRRRDILWQDMQVMTAQVEKLDLQKAVLEEQCDLLEKGPQGAPPELAPTLKSKEMLLQPLQTMGEES